MARKIEIRDRDSNGSLEVDLVDILESLQEVGATLAWRIVSIEARGDIGGMWQGGMLAFEEAVAKSEGGMAVTWTQLLALGDGIDQTIDCRVVGADPKCDDTVIAIEAVDSDQWRVETNISSVATELTRRFRTAQELNQ